MPSRSMRLFGIPLLGLSSDALHRLLLTAATVIGVGLASWLVGRVLDVLLGGRRERVEFRVRQIARLLLACLLVLLLVSIWFDDAGRLATVAGLVSAGVAIALQRVITSFAGYLILLRGGAFNVGDRITIGGVRGDVIALGFMQTTVMEMGQAPGEQHDDPSTWVQARQYTGRLVRVTNDKIFDSPVYNYSRDFPYLWEEMRIPISYQMDRRRAEEILLDVARRHTAPIVAEAGPALAELQRHYFLREPLGVEARVYLRLTDNWVELSLRFIAPVRGIRELKDAMSRDVLSAFEAAHIGIASATFEIVGLPPLRIEPAGGGRGPVAPGAFGDA